MRIYNLSSPVETEHQEAENVAFSAYANHQVQLDNIVEMILDGETEFDLVDDLSDSDLDYINQKLNSYGLDADFEIR